MARITRIVWAVQLLLLVAALHSGGCQSPPSTTPAATIDPSRCCPLTGVVIESQEHVAYFDTYPVYFASAEAVAQFGSFTPEDQAICAAAQVLPRKGIDNRTCPMTGSQLAASAVLVIHLDQPIGFADQASAASFLALRPETQDALLARWRLTLRARQASLRQSADAG